MAESSKTVTEIEGRRLTLSNLEKVMYPATGLTKAGVIDYYARIAPVMLPHLRRRAVTMVRWPDGVDGPSFFEKRCPPHAPEWVQTAEVDATDELLAADPDRVAGRYRAGAVLAERPEAVVGELDRARRLDLLLLAGAAREGERQQQREPDTGLEIRMHATPPRRFGRESHPAPAAKRLSCGLAGRKRPMADDQRQRFKVRLSWPRAITIVSPLTRMVKLSRIFEPSTVHWAETHHALPERRSDLNAQWASCWS